jgi:hypothetical protein
MADNSLDTNKLAADLVATRALRDPRDADRARDDIKTAALISIARSLEGNKVPDHWEALEGPSGAILGWFDPQVARAIAQALGATQARNDGEPEAAPVEVGSLVVLTAMAEQAEAMGDITTVGEVTELGESEGTVWARVIWGNEPDGTVDEGKVWVSELTVVGRAGDKLVEVQAEDAEGNPVTVTGATEGADELAQANAEADMLGDPTEVAGVTSDGTVIEPDDEPAPAPEPEVDDDDIDADFDTVVETTSAPDGLAAIRKGKGKR